MTAYWAFSANPERYRIVQAVSALGRSGRLDSWTTQNSRLRAGDKAFIWKQKARGSHRGVVALADIVSDPELIDDSNNPYWVDPSGAAETEERVRVRYRLIEGLPLWIDDPAGAVLEQLSVSRAQGGTVFIVQPAQWRAVLDALPPAQRPDARAYCRRLVGHTVFTITQRRPNRVLAVSDDAVQVATDRSPGGEWVPLVEVEAALSLLFDRRAVGVNVDELASHRSSFLGALLASLPHAMTETNPQRVSLAGPTEIAMAADFELLLGVNAGSEGSAPGAGPGLEVRRLTWHLRAEGRNPRLPQAAKLVHGTTCQVCRVNPIAEYGVLGSRCVEAHHLRPFSELSDDPVEIDPHRDFAIVCSNCHRMLHSRTPPLTLEELRACLPGRGAKDRPD